MRPSDRLGVHRLRDHLEHLGLGIAQLLGDLRHSVVVELGDLLLLLGDRLAGLGDVGFGVSDLALQPERGALKLQDARPGDQPSLDQRRDVLGFRLNRSDLVGIGLHLRLAADDLRSELVDLLPDDAALTLDRRAPAFELAESGRSRLLLR